MKQQTQISRKASHKRCGRVIPLLLLIFLAVAFTYYFYRDTLYAYWEPQNPPDISTDAELPEEPTPKAEVPPPAAEPSPYPPPEGEILLIADGNYLLALVTKRTSLGDYKPTDLVLVPKEMWMHDHPYELREETCRQFIKMWEDAKTEGINFFITSAFRSYDVQKNVYNNHVSRHGETAADKFSAKPGHSEHQLGTTVDLAIPGYVLTQRFAETTEGKWLAANAYKYGFVMSYPQDATEITGYIFEPWHFRYIGVENAAAWKASGLVLNQWLERQPQHWIK